MSLGSASLPIAHAVEAVMHQSNWILFLNFGLLLCGASLEIFYLCDCCCFRA